MVRLEIYKQFQVEHVVPRYEYKDRQAMKEESKRFRVIDDEFNDKATIGLAKARLKLAVFFQMSYPGAPAVYYGDEVGMTGGDDPMIGTAQVEALRKELTAAGARFEIISYPGTKHSFTNPDADKAGVAGLGYSPTADKESFAALTKMLREVFGS